VLAETLKPAMYCRSPEQRHEFQPITDIILFQKRRNMIPGGKPTYPQMAANLFVGKPLQQQTQYFLFSTRHLHDVPVCE
jgi:hypothetical protein